MSSDDFPYSKNILYSRIEPIRRICCHSIKALCLVCTQGIPVQFGMAACH